MTDLYKAKTQKTYSKLNAGQLIKKAKIIETMSGDYLIRVGDVDLCLNDDYELTISGYSICICVMDLNPDEIAKMEILESKVEDFYEEKMTEQYA